MDLTLDKNDVPQEKVVHFDIYKNGNQNIDAEEYNSYINLYMYFLY